LDFYLLVNQLDFMLIKGNLFQLGKNMTTLVFICGMMGTVFT